MTLLFLFFDEDCRSFKRHAQRIPSGHQCIVEHIDLILGEPHLVQEERVEVSLGDVLRSLDKAARLHSEERVQNVCMLQRESILAGNSIHPVMFFQQ